MPSPHQPPLAARLVAAGAKRRQSPDLDEVGIRAPCPGAHHHIPLVVSISALASSILCTGRHIADSSVVAQIIMALSVHPCWSMGAISSSGRSDFSRVPQRGHALCLLCAASFALPSLTISIDDGARSEQLQRAGKPWRQQPCQRHSACQPKCIAWFSSTTFLGDWRHMPGTWHSIDPAGAALWTAACRLESTEPSRSSTVRTAQGRSRWAAGTTSRTRQRQRD